MMDIEAFAREAWSKGGFVPPEILSFLTDFGRKCHAEGYEAGKLEAVIGDAEAVTAYKNGYEAGKADSIKVFSDQERKKEYDLGYSLGSIDMRERAAKVAEEWSATPTKNKALVIAQAIRSLK
jgi:hypothetical protein